MSPPDITASSTVMIACRQHEAFMRAHAWALDTKCTSLLLAPTERQHAAELAARFDVRLLLTDNSAAFAGCGAPVCDAALLPDFQPMSLHARPDTRHPLAILLTSGSTGQPKPVIKTARAVRGECGLLQALWSTLPPLREVISTVALEHMFGYTFGFWLPQQAGARLHGRRPLTPGELNRTCASASHPAWIVTTPTHLRAYVQSSERFPLVAGLICATSLLGTELARAVVDRFQAPILEIYGSTETGAIASRLRDAHEVVAPAWLPLPGVRLTTDANGAALCHLEHVEGVIELGDLIDPAPPGFRLVGRRGDLVKIGGKRHSLAALNQHLLAVPGVLDGAYYVPDSDGTGEPERAVAFVVLAPGMETTDVLQALRGRIDDVFLPRRIGALPALPRNDTGKLKVSDLAQMHHSLQRTHLPQQEKDI